MRSRVARAMLMMAIGLAGLAAFGGTPSAAASGDRLVVNVPEPFEVSGKVYPAGPLAVRHLGAYSPTAKFDRITADGGCVGILVAERHPEEEGGLLHAALVFTRSPQGHLILVGYTTGDAPAGQLYVYRDTVLDGAPTASTVIASR